jgi:hypothetical protein
LSKKFMLAVLKTIPASDGLVTNEGKCQLPTMCDNSLINQGSTRQPGNIHPPLRGEDRNSAGTSSAYARPESRFPEHPSQCRVATSASLFGYQPALTVDQNVMGEALRGEHGGQISVFHQHDLRLARITL